MRKQKGFIAFTAVLVLSALFLSLVITATTRSVGSIQGNIAIHNASAAESLAAQCAEYARLEIVRNLHYEGDETLTLEANECEILPIDEEGDARTIRTQAEVGGYVFKYVVEIEEIGPELVVSSYQSVIVF